MILRCVKEQNNDTCPTLFSEIQVSIFKCLALSDQHSSTIIDNKMEISKY